MGLDPVFAMILTWAFALLFSVGAIHKVAHVRRFLGTLKAYRLGPDLLAPVVAGLVVLMESFAALLLLLGSVRAGALLTMTLLAIYASAIGINLLRGRTQIDCGCHFGRGTGQISAALVVRNGALCVVAAVLLMPTAVRSWTWLDGAACLFGILSACALYLMSETLIRNRQFWRWSQA